MMVVINFMMILLMSSCFGFVIVARFALLKIKDELPEVYQSFHVDRECFSEDGFNRMDVNTQIALYKILAFSKLGTYKPISIHQKLFRFFVISAFLMIALMIYLIILESS